MKSTIVFLILTTILGLSYGLDVKSCPSGLKLPKNVEVKGCSKPPCKIQRGTDLIADILFTTNGATTSLRPQLSAKVFGMKLPINLPKEHQNVCEHLQNLKCPLKENQDVLYHIQVPVLKSYPSMKTEIEVNLIGDGNKNHMCFKIEGQIV